MDEIITRLKNIKFLKNLVEIKEIDNELTLEDYDLIETFQRHNCLESHNFYQICEFVYRVKEEIPMTTYNALLQYENLKIK